MELGLQRFWIWRAYSLQFSNRIKLCPSKDRRFADYHGIIIVLKNFPFRFSFDLHQPIIFETIFLISCYVSFLIPIFTIGFDGIILESGSNIVAHLRILQRNLKELKNKDEIQLRKLIEYHNSIFDVFNKLVKLYAPWLFIQIFFVTTSFCFIGISIIVVILIWNQKRCQSLF